MHGNHSLPWYHRSGDVPGSLWTTLYSSPAMCHFFLAQILLCMSAQIFLWLKIWLFCSFPRRPSPFSMSSTPPTPDTPFSSFKPFRKPQHSILSPTPPRASQRCTAFYPVASRASQRCRAFYPTSYSSLSITEMHSIPQWHVSSPEAFEHSAVFTHGSSRNCE